MQRGQGVWSLLGYPGVHRDVCESETLSRVDGEHTSHDSYEGS